jgi:hypothetical protein
LLFEDAHVNGPFFANVKVVNSLMNYEVGAPSREKSGVVFIRMQKILFPYRDYIRPRNIQIYFLISYT